MTQFGVQTPNIGTDLNLNDTIHIFPSLPSADNLVGCLILGVGKYYTQVYAPDI